MYFIFLCFTVLIYKMGILIMPTEQAGEIEKYIFVKALEHNKCSINNKAKN